MKTYNPETHISLECIFEIGDDGDAESGPSPFMNLVFYTDNLDKLQDFCEGIMKGRTEFRMITFGEICKVQLPFGYMHEHKLMTLEEYETMKSEEENFAYQNI